jgi:hypothetical protein
MTDVGASRKIIMCFKMLERASFQSISGLGVRGVKEKMICRAAEWIDSLLF